MLWTVRHLWFVRRSRQVGRKGLARALSSNKNACTLASAQPRCHIVAERQSACAMEDGHPRKEPEYLPVPSLLSLAFGLRFPFSRLSKMQPREPPPPAIRRRELKSDTARNGEFNLCASRRTTQDSESRADSFGPLAHSRQTPVPVASCPDYQRVNPAAIVANEKSQVARCIFEF